MDVIEVAEDKKVSRIAKFVNDRIFELKGVKTQKDIATRAGYTNANMITMIKQGYTKVALDRVVDLADALDADPKLLLILAMEQFYSHSFIKQMMKVLEVEDPYAGTRD